MSHSRHCKFRALGERRNRCIRCGLEITSPHPPEKIYAPCSQRRDGLGDRLARLLSWLGITPRRVSHLIGRPCDCPKRQEALNRLGHVLAEKIRPK